MIKVEWPASQKICELNMLQKFLKDKNIKKILEIGTFFGGTTLLWAKMVEPDGRVYTLDQNFHPGRQCYYGTKWESLITEIQGDSHKEEIKERVKSVIGGLVDFLFVDGDHLYEGVKKDFDYRDLVKEGGFIGFHDIRDTEFHRNLPPPDGPCMVAKFWNEIKNSYEHWEFLDPDDATYMGIGVLKIG